MIDTVKNPPGTPFGKRELRDFGIALPDEFWRW